MCGIAGFSLHPDEDVDALALSRSLLVAIEPRGPHATGAAWTEADGSTYWHKAGTNARRYVGTLPMPPTSTVAILHTRWATQGDPKINRNNHPFALPGVTGIHNGKVYNDAAIFDRLGVERTCETDSEAIFAMLAHDDYDSPTECLARLDADAAVAWIETDRPDDLHLARLDGRPLACAETDRGSLVYASTEPMLRLGAAGHGLVLRRTWEVPPFTYLRFRSGEPMTSRRFVLDGRAIGHRRRRLASEGRRPLRSTSSGQGSAADWLAARARVDPRLGLGRP